MITWMDEYIHPNLEGVLSWLSTNSFASDSKESLEHWKHRLHEVSTRRCACITCTLNWIGDEVCDPLNYDGLTYIDSFVK